MRFWAIAGAVNAVLAIATGAFGAHTLRGRVPVDRLATFETASRYQMYHALGLIAVAWLASERSEAVAARAGWPMLAGIVLFSGSLYALVLADVPRLGAITPLGGIAFMVGWVFFAIGVAR